MPVVAQPVKRARWLPGHALETVDLSSELGIEIGSHMLGWGGEVHDACGTWATVRGIDEDGCLLDMQATLMRHSTAIDTKNWPLFDAHRSRVPVLAIAAHIAATWNTEIALRSPTPLLTSIARAGLQHAPSPDLSVVMFDGDRPRVRNSATH